jgi:hypothetical protein
METDQIDDAIELLQQQHADQAGVVAGLNQIATDLVELVAGLEEAYYVPPHFVRITPQAGVDIGEQINEAIDTATVLGLDIELPWGSHRYQVPINIGPHSRIRLFGHGMPVRHWKQLGGNDFAGTQLVYDAPGWGIVCGEPGATVNHVANILQGFQLKFTENAIGGVLADECATQHYLRDFSIRGVDRNGIGLQTVGRGNHSWVCENFQARYCAVAVDLNGAYSWEFNPACTFNNNRTAVRLGQTKICSGVNFMGGDMEGNTEVCVRIINAARTNLNNVHCELPDDPDVRFVRAGGGKIAGLNITGCGVNPGSTVEHAIELGDVLGATIGSNVFSGIQQSVIKNLGGNRLIRLPGNVYGENGLAALIDNMAAVVYMEDRLGTVHIPNLVS